MDRDIDPVRNSFAAHFPDAEGVRLPADWRRLGEGSINDPESAWLVNWKRDEDGVFFFASNRFSSDDLHHIGADGTSERLGYGMSMFAYRPQEGEDRATGRKRAKDAYYAHNRAFYSQVSELGLDRVPASGSTMINAALRSGLADGRKTQQPEPSS